MAAAVTVLALLTVFAIELSDTQARSRRDVIARVHERSVLAAALIDSLIKSQLQVPELEALFGGRTVAPAALKAGPQGEYLVVLDSRGGVLASSQGLRVRVRDDLALSRAIDIVRTGAPYGLGNLVPPSRGGTVVLAAAFPTRFGERYLVAGIGLGMLSGFLQAELRRIPGVKGAHNYVIDANDTVLASTNPRIPAGFRFRGRAAVALSKTSGDRWGHYYDETRVADSTWRIVLASPDGPLFASVSGIRSWLPWLIFAAFALVAAAALMLGLRVVRSAEIDLRKANVRLASVNEELEQANAALAHDALHDPLTGLPNRTLFMDRLEQMLERCARDPFAGCAVLFVDLDGFKLVNDRFTHTTGDRCLVEVAERFRLALRPGDTVARLGGDEFSVLLDSVATEPEAALVVARVHAALSDPIDLDGHRLSVRASVGIAFGSADTSAPEVLRQADVAMYATKRRRQGGSVPSGSVFAQAC
jgi:diguanylate cyclase (GGDEF)-like protein